MISVLGEEPARRQALEASRRYADDFRNEAVDTHRAADHGRVAPEQAHPERMAQHRHQRGVGRVISWGQSASELHARPQGPEVVSIDQRAARRERRHPATRHAHTSQEREREDPDIGRSGLAQRPVQRVAEVAPQGRTRLRVPIVGRTALVDRDIAIPVPRKQLQLRRILDRQRRQQQRPHDSEHRRVRANADREREHGDRREARALAQHPQHVPEIRPDSPHFVSSRSCVDCCTTPAAPAPRMFDRCSRDGVDGTPATTRYGQAVRESA